MKKRFPLPLQIDCTGLSRKLITELASHLALHFKSVHVWDSDDITAANPLSIGSYDIAWRILDRFGVKVS